MCERMHRHQEIRDTRAVEIKRQHFADLNIVYALNMSALDPRPCIILPLLMDRPRHPEVALLLYCGLIAFARGVILRFLPYLLSNPPIYCITM
jgi:hypothetical protein